MNDRLKFRVFGLCCNSKLEKNWVNITEVGNFLIDKDGNLMDASAYFDPINHPEHFIIEQCTGFSDKSGNLIYEGDIVLGTSGFKYCIIWSEMELGWALQNLETRLCIAMNAFMPDEIEIIGNIHEQAEQKDK